MFSYCLFNSSHIENLLGSGKTLVALTNCILSETCKGQTTFVSIVSTALTQLKCRGDVSRNSSFGFDPAAVREGMVSFTTNLVDYHDLSGVWRMGHTLCLFGWNGVRDNLFHHHGDGATTKSNIVHSLKSVPRGCPEAAQAFTHLHNLSWRGPGRSIWGFSCQIGTPSHRLSTQTRRLAGGGFLAILVMYGVFFLMQLIPCISGSLFGTFWTHLSHRQSTASAQLRWPTRPSRTS